MLSLRKLEIGPRLILAAVLLLMVLPLAASASTVILDGAPLTYTGTNGSNLAAEAVFTLTTSTINTNINNLTVVLTNTSTSDVTAPAEVLTALFFNSVPSPLTPVSAVVTAGSTVFFGGTDPDGVVGGEWAYRAGYGTSSAGFSIFGPGDRFPGTNLQGPDSPDGIQYGLTSAGDNPLTGNQKVTGSQALIHNSVTFTLSTAANQIDFSGVRFQYGTALTDPSVTGTPSGGGVIPVPPSVWLLASGLVGLGLLGWRRRSGR